MKKIALFLICSLAHLLIYSFAFAQPPASPARAQWLSGIGSPNSSGNGLTDERLTQLKMDSKGNTYVCGVTYRDAYIKTHGQHNNRTQLTGTQQQQQSIGQATKGFIAKYDCGGQMVWFKEIGDSILNSSVNDICMDTAGNIYAVAQVDYGMYDTYWGDSLIIPIVNPFPNGWQGAGIVFKIDGAGKMLWHWSIQQQWGNNINFQLFVGNGIDRAISDLNYNTMIAYHDTLSLIGTLDTLIGNVPYSQQIFNFNAITGQYLQPIIICKQYSAPSFSIGGLGKDKDGNMMATGAIGSSQPNKILDSTFAKNTQYGRTIILTFKGNHFMNAIVFNDSTGASVCNFDSPENGFEVIENVVQGTKVIDNFVVNTKTSQGVGNGSFGALLHFDKNKKFKWGACADTSVNGQGFYATTQDIHGNIYAYALLSDYFKMQGYSRNFGSAFYATFNMKFNLNDSLITAIFPDLPPLSAFSNFGMVNSMAVNEKGEITEGGFFSNSQLLAAGDSATYTGGMFDFFTLKYGYPCSTDSALI